MFGLLFAEDRLSQQIWGPLLAANEMANPSVGYIIDKPAPVNPDMDREHPRS